MSGLIKGLWACVAILAVIAILLGTAKWHGLSMKPKWRGVRTDQVKVWVETYRERYGTYPGSPMDAPFARMVLADSEAAFEPAPAHNNLYAVYRLNGPDRGYVNHFEYIAKGADAPPDIMYVYQSSATGRFIAPRPTERIIPRRRPTRWEIQVLASGFQERTGAFPERLDDPAFLEFACKSQPIVVAPIDGHENLWRIGLPSEGDGESANLLVYTVLGGESFPEVEYVYWSPLDERYHVSGPSGRTIRRTGSTAEATK